MGVLEDAIERIKKKSENRRLRKKSNLRERAMIRRRDGINGKNRRKYISKEDLLREVETMQMRIVI